MGEATCCFTKSFAHPVILAVGAPWIVGELAVKSLAQPATALGAKVVGDDRKATLRAERSNGAGAILGRELPWKKSEASLRRAGDAWDSCERKAWGKRVSSTQHLCYETRSIHL